MRHRLSAFFDDYLLPLVQRPDMVQTAALCLRGSADDRQVLLITSRGTGRWVIPKGGLMRGTDAAGAAVVEAWEEAGVRPVAAPTAPLGDFTYRKIKSTGLPVRVRVLVYPLEVESLAEDFPEAGQRTRRWVDVGAAAEMVAEPGLRAIFRDLASGNPVTEPL